MVPARAQIVLKNRHTVMIQLIDRRLNGWHKSALNRQRFIRRYKEQIKSAIAERSITDVANGGQVSIPRRDIGEPEFGFGAGGARHRVHPGNREFAAGDLIERPDGGGQDGGSQAGEDGAGEDEFTFKLTREEFMELFFEDLALPNLHKTQLQRLHAEDSVRAGFNRDGVPTNIDVVRSLQGALARRIALRAPCAANLRKPRRAWPPRLAKRRHHCRKLLRSRAPSPHSKRASGKCPSSMSSTCAITIGSSVQSPKLRP